MEKTLTACTREKLKEIYTNEKFRNEVATAHGCSDKHGKHLYYKALGYPDSYIVTEEQIAEAQAECDRAKKVKIAEIKANPQKIVFVGMGCTYDPRWPGDIGNYRIRTEFTSASGNRFFLEVGTSSSSEDMRVDFAIDRTMQERLDDDINQQSKFFNYKGLEKGVVGKYTFDTLLNLINKYFDCYFTEIEVDNYTLDTEDFNCVSPKGKVTPKERIKLIVIDEHTLGYQIADRSTAGILASSVILGSPMPSALDTTITLAGKKVRLASEKDFEKFRVSFKGYENKQEYEYAEVN